ncbi:hypothetical protein D9M73_245960 [compost metagenome]
MQCGHALLAHRIKARQRCLGAGNGVVVQMGNQAFGSLPGLGIGLAHNYMQTNPEAHAAALLGGLGANLLDLLGNRLRWLTPSQVQLDLLSGKILCSL